VTIVVTRLKDRLPTTLRTQRLVLVTPTLAHAPAIAALANNVNVHKWMARLPFPYGLSDAEFFINEIVPSAAEGCYAILRDDILIGVVGLHFADGQVPELGYWLGEPYWGHGYATEAAQAVVAAARAAGARALRSRALSDNHASRNVLRKAGFIQTQEGPEPIGPNKGKPAVFLYLEFSPR
jgi:RimJ/RimL family protein N-acetyltransferase